MFSNENNVQTSTPVSGCLDREDLRRKANQGWTKEEKKKKKSLCLGRVSQFFYNAREIQRAKRYPLRKLTIQEKNKSNINNSK